MSKILELISENVKRLKAVHIVPEGNFIVISGENGEGKSSVIDSIAMALGGAEQFDQVPIHNGETEAVTIVKTEDYIITRHWTANNTSYLKVEANVQSDMKPVFPSPQTLLNRLIGSLTFDPLAFLQKDPKEQVNMLIKLSDLKIDPNEMDQKIKDLSALRRDVNRDLDKFKKLIADLPEPEANTPDEEISINDLIQEKDRINLQIREHDKLKTNLNSLKIQEESLIRDQNNCAERIFKLEESLKKERQNLEQWKRLHEDNIKLIQKAETAISTHKVDNLNEVDVKILKAQEVNKIVRAKKSYIALEAQRDEAFTESEKYTGQIEQIRQDKVNALAFAKFPIEGLSFDDMGVTFNKLPLKQASQADKIRVCFAIAVALNKASKSDFKVIMTKEADKLDKKNMRLLAKLAEDAGYQFWVEKVYEDEFPAIIIEDGSIKEITKGGELTERKEKV